MQNYPHLRTIATFMMRFQNQVPIFIRFNMQVASSGPRFQSKLVKGEAVAFLRGEGGKGREHPALMAEMPSLALLS